MAQYLVMLDESYKRIYCLKCTGDPEVLANWTAQDKAITVGSQIKSMWAVLDGTDIHVVSQRGINGAQNRYYHKVEYHKFDTTSDTWTIIREEDNSGVGTPQTESILGCSLGVRSDGDVIVLWCSSSNVYYDRREAGVWTDYNIINNDGSVYTGVIVKGASDRMHFFYFNDTDDDVLHRSLSAANALDNEATVDAAVGAAVLHPIGRGISYVDNGNTVVKAPFLDADEQIDSARFNSQANPVINVDDQASDNDAEDINSSLVACLAIDSTDTWLLYSGGGASGVDQDIYYDTQADGGAWGADTEDQDGVTCNRINAGVYERGGTKLGYVWLNGATVDFEELDIDGAPPVGQPTPIRTQGTPTGSGYRDRIGGWN